VSEEREDGECGDGQDAGSQAPSLLSNTLRYINLAEVDKSLFFIADKARAKMCKGVGAVRDKGLKLEDGKASHTLV